MAIIKTTATGSLVTKIIVITIKPIATPIGRTLTDLRSVMNLAAITAPSAIPTATTPCRYDACDRSNPSALAAQSSTMNCSVAPAPQNSVVVASEICPSLSHQSTTTQREKSRMRNSGFMLGARWSTPVSGMYQLKIAGSTEVAMVVARVALDARGHPTQPPGRDQRGEDAVLRRRVGGCAEADDRIGQQRVDRDERHQAAGHLDRIGDQHHASLGPRVR